MTRREFIGTTGAALGTAMTLPSSLLAAQPAPRALLGFSKPFTHLSPEESADLVAEVGWDGIDCPVRARLTHVLPERVEEDLPRLIEALKSRGKTIPVVTTDIVRLDARTEKLLRTLARLDIRTYRFGFVKYNNRLPPEETVREFSAALRDLSACNRELGLRGGYQNHSGRDYLGATIWELWLAMRDLDPTTIGLCFDIGQAMVEGGLSWPSQIRLLRSQWWALQLKDFVWENTPSHGWNPRWCPLGEGRVNRDVVEQIGTRTFAGPVIQHHEHIGPRMPRAELTTLLRREFSTLRSWLN